MTAQAEAEIREAIHLRTELSGRALGRWSRCNIPLTRYLLRWILRCKDRTPDITEQVEAFMDPLPVYPGQPTRAIVEAIDYVAAERPSARRPVWAEISLLPDYRAESDLFGHRLHEVRPLGTTVRILRHLRPGQDIDPALRRRQGGRGIVGTGRPSRRPLGCTGST